MFVTICKNKSEYIFNVNELYLFWTLETELLCRCLWALMRVTEARLMLGNLQLPLAKGGLSLLLRQVSALGGPLSWRDLKADPDMRFFLPSFPSPFLCQVSGLRRLLFLGSSTSCQSPECLLPSWHLFFTEPWHVLAFDESEDTKSTGASFFLFFFESRFRG